jgi:hypothetical protein
VAMVPGLGGACVHPGGGDSGGGDAHRGNHH